jgi:translation initiation factor 1A
MPFRGRGGGGRGGGRGRGGGGRGRGRGKQEETVHELKLPTENESIGFVMQSVGASNFRVMCSDKLQRMCSIPGRLRRRFWIKEGDLVIVKPWVVQGDERADIIWRFSLGDRERLKARGYDVPG